MNYEKFQTEALPSRQSGDWWELLPQDPRRREDCDAHTNGLRSLPRCRSSMPCAQYPPRSPPARRHRRGDTACWDSLAATARAGQPGDVEAKITGKSGRLAQSPKQALDNLEGEDHTMTDTLLRPSTGENTAESTSAG